MTRVFLNYRADDEPFGVAMLDRALSDRFGSAAVFLASKSIPLGSDWEPRMLDAVAGSAAVLVVMGRYWRSAENRRRLEDPADFVRREILLALELRKQVIPVRLAIPRLSKEDLPEDLAELFGKQDIEVRFRSAAIDIEHLAAKLAELIPDLRGAVTAARPAGSGATNVVQHSRVGNVWQAEVMTFGDFHAGPTSG